MAPYWSGLLLATVGSLDGHGVRPSSGCVLNRTNPANITAGRCTLFFEKYTQRVLIVGARLSTEHDNEALLEKRPL